MESSIMFLLIFLMASQIDPSIGADKGDFFTKGKTLDIDRDPQNYEQYAIDSPEDERARVKVGMVSKHHNVNVKGTLGPDEAFIVQRFEGNKLKCVKATMMPYSDNTKVMKEHHNTISIADSIKDGERVVKYKQRAPKDNEVSLNVYDKDAMSSPPRGYLKKPPKKQNTPRGPPPSREESFRKEPSTSLERDPRKGKAPSTALSKTSRTGSLYEKAFEMLSPVPSPAGRRNSDAQAYQQPAKPETVARKSFSGFFTSPFSKSSSKKQNKNTT